MNVPGAGDMFDITTHAIEVEIFFLIKIINPNLLITKNAVN